MQTWKKTILLSSGLLAIILIVNRNKKKLMDLLPPLRARISSPFGQRGAEFHNGIDLAVPEGTPIQASGDGVVINVYKGERGGLQMTTKLDKGLRLGYAHLSKTILATGDRFRKGDIIALSGNSGKTTGSHLHFTLRDSQGELLNPQDYFSFA